MSLPRAYRNVEASDAQVLDSWNPNFRADKRVQEGRSENGVFLIIIEERNSKQYFPEIEGAKQTKEMILHAILGIRVCRPLAILAR